VYSSIKEQLRYQPFVCSLSFCYKSQSLLVEISDKMIYYPPRLFTSEINTVCEKRPLKGVTILPLRASCPQRISILAIRILLRTKRRIEDESSQTMPCLTLILNPWTERGAQTIRMKKQRPLGGVNLIYLLI
jgi:hypothetical protein